jgi:hypothetical protein
MRLILSATLALAPLLGQDNEPAKRVIVTGGVRPPHSAEKLMGVLNGFSRREHREVPTGTEP